MPYISNEALVGAGLLVAVAVGYHFIPKATSTSASSANKKRKNKNKKRAVPGAATAVDEPLSSEEGKNGKNGKRKDAAAGGTAASAQKHTTTTANASKAGESAPSFAEVAAPASTDPAPRKPKTLAEKLAPQPRKTKVDDMLAPEDLPAKHARVMRVTGPDVKVDPPVPSVSELEQKVGKFEEDYASGSDEETTGTGVSRETDDGWNVVAGKSKTKKNEPNGSPASSFSTPAAIPGMSSDAATRIQRKNAKRNEAKKAAKEAEEAERQRRLRMHKRDLEKEKINSLYAPKVKGMQTSKGFGGATVDNHGQLIWD